MKKNNLDEMQEQELLKIEHNGCWLAFWGLLAVMAACGAYTAWGSRSPALAWSFYPRTGGAAPGPYAVSVCGAYALLCALPLLVDLAEELRWAAERRRQ